MKKNDSKKSEIKPENEFREVGIVSYLLTLLLIFTGQLLGMPISNICEQSENAVIVTAGMYFSFLGIWVVTILFCLLIDRKKWVLESISTKQKGNRVSFLLLGFVIGFLLNGSCILGASLHKDIFLFYDSVQIIPLIVVLAAVFVQSAAEEFLCRGFLYQRLIRSYKKPIVAILGNSLFFALLHIANPGFTIVSLTNIMLSGILFSLFVYFWDSIWCAMAIHTAWNYTQNIIFGLPNSGIVEPFSIWKLDAMTARDSFAYNVAFGVEGTVLADLVLAIAIVLVYFIGVKATGKNLFWNKNECVETAENAIENETESGTEIGDGMNG